LNWRLPGNIASNAERLPEVSSIAGDRASTRKAVYSRRRGELGWPARGYEQSQGVVAPGSAYRGMPVHIACNGFSGSGSLKRSRIPSTHEVLEWREREEVKKLFLAGDLLPRGAVRLGPPNGAQDAIAIELRQVAERTRAGDFRGHRQRGHMHKT
jgi:hypothetical protein